MRETEQTRERDLKRERDSVRYIARYIYIYIQMVNLNPVFKRLAFLAGNFLSSEGTAAIAVRYVTRVSSTTSKYTRACNSRSRSAIFINDNLFIHSKFLRNICSFFCFSHTNINLSLSLSLMDNRSAQPERFNLRQKFHAQLIPQFYFLAQFSLTGMQMGLLGNYEISRIII